MLSEMRLQYLLIIGTVVLFGLIIDLIRRDKIEVKYAIIWLVFSLVMILFSLSSKKAIYESIISSIASHNLIHL